MILSWLGLFLGVAGILLGQVLEGGHLVQLLQPTAAMIVFGGSLGATMLSSNMSEFSHAIRGTGKVFFHKGHDFGPLVKELVSIATVARREGILALDRLLGEIKSPFLANFLRHVIDGYDPNIVKEMMEDRISREEEEKVGAAKVWETAGGYSPTMGILGAVMGLIHVMSNLSDSSKLGSGIAVAFVATVYGVGGANLLLIPIGNKLKKIAAEEILELQLMYTGVMGIQGGVNPRVIEDRLNNLLLTYTNIDEKGAPGAEKKAA
ncbi:MAG: flagellar motor protein [Deltaproteobacteria bacterium]|nr:flagellar motor protein [Deltaproteobacteria bacterium]